MGLFLLLPLSALAGSLDSPAAPTDAGSAMYTLEDIYNRLNAGTAGTKRTGAFTEPTSGPTSGTGYTLDDVMGKAPTVDDTNGLTPSETTSGKTFWGLNSGTWGLQTGSNANVVDTSTGDAVAGEILSGKIAYVDGSEVTGSLASQTLSAASTTVSAGNYAATTLTAVDSDLAAGNITSGVTIFGVAGSASSISAGVAATGQTTSYDGSSLDDGGLQKGVAWPSPRFTSNVDNNDDGDCADGGETCDGTVTDNLTGLIWLKNANCAAATRNWATAITDVASLNSAGTMNTNNCGDTSNGGSYQTDWRLPNVKELQSLIDFAYTLPPLSDAAGTAKWSSGDAFTGVQSANYWSSTTFRSDPSFHWAVALTTGAVRTYTETNTFDVWPVRGP